jgi:ADP-ribose pyrophosphatase
MSADGAQPADPRLQAWELLDRKEAFKTPWFKIDQQQMTTTKGAPAEYFVHEGRDGVICVCFDDQTGKIYLEQQYRVPVGRVTTDYPAGNMEAEDASPEESVRRELREEIGFEARELKKLAALDMNPGFSRNRLHIFLARGTASSEPEPDTTESIVPVLATPREILEMVQDGRISCTFCVSSTFMAFKELGLLKAAE